jgi:hypothetical protein
VKARAVEAKEKPRGRSSEKGSARAGGSARKATGGRIRAREIPETDPSQVDALVVREVAAQLQTDDSVKRALITRVTRALADALRDATPASLQQAVEAPTDAGSMAHLLSMAVIRNAAISVLDPLAAAIVRGAMMKQDMLNRAGGVLDTARVAELLGISRQGVAKRVRSGTLLAIPDGSGHLQFPALQFTDTGTVDGLEKVLAAFNVESPWTRLAVLLDTDETVGGRRVIDALRAGDLDAVLDVVRSFGA